MGAAAGLLARFRMNDSGAYGTASGRISNREIRTDKIFERHLVIPTHAVSNYQGLMQVVCPHRGMCGTPVIKCQRSSSRASGAGAAPALPLRRRRDRRACHVQRVVRRSLCNRGQRIALPRTVVASIHPALLILLSRIDVLPPAIPPAIRRFCTLHARRERRNRRIKTPDCASALSAVRPKRSPAACGARSRPRFYSYHRRRQGGDSFCQAFPKSVATNLILCLKHSEVVSHIGEMTNEDDR